jgi:hypothetical protein
MGFHISLDGKPPIAMFALQSFKEPEAWCLFREQPTSLRFAINCRDDPKNICDL